MSREAFDIEAALEKCHKGTAWQRDLIHAQLIAAQADAFERAAKVCRKIADNPEYGDLFADGAVECEEAIRALAKETT
jgi:hypothetical protein